jgi:hypothetical protein
MDGQALEQQEKGVAPADARAYRPWGTWKIALAYAIFFAVAVLSILSIDGHVLATPDPLSK